ncbi:MAG TPA: hypothetical protein VK701_05705 [Solirubrobacteraceae bacterium]|jgi:hypothetical protein|nr:hypothetical protein [Solirubrobacteraceae bacterium]
MRFGGLLVALILVVGLGGAVIALHSREQNTQFVSQQQALAPVRAGELERLILTTSDPRPGYDHPPARARLARCVSFAPRAALGNPWSCVVRYAHPPDVRYRVTVRAEGSIYGSGQPEGAPLRGVLTVRGCCVVPGQ